MPCGFRKRKKEERSDSRDIELLNDWINEVAVKMTTACPEMAGCLSASNISMNANIEMKMKMFDSMMDFLVIQSKEKDEKIKQLLYYIESQKIEENKTSSLNQMADEHLMKSDHQKMKDQQVQIDMLKKLLSEEVFREREKRQDLWSTIDKQMATIMKLRESMNTMALKQNNTNCRSKENSTLRNKQRGDLSRDLVTYSDSRDKSPSLSFESAAKEEDEEWLSTESGAESKLPMFASLLQEPWLLEVRQPKTETRQWKPIEAQQAEMEKLKRILNTSIGHMRQT